MFPYSPVLRSAAGPYSGAALVGTCSAAIGWSFDDPALRRNLHGFAVRRTDFDNATGEMLRLQWLGGYKRFIETDDGRTQDVGSLTAPFQRFRWSDYTLNPARSYRYEVFPMRGTPANLTRGEDPLVFEFSPTPEDDGNLGVFVNRGVTAAKAYFERFKDTHPRDVIPAGAAYAWLSRGLKESLLRFIAGAQGGEALHVAIYEFFDHEIAQALKDARDRGVAVEIVHDAKPGKKSTAENFEVIDHFGLQAIAVPRTTVNISHNKLVVHLADGVPRAAWTGSANFSENAFNYQTNTGLIVRDAAMVRHFEDYFQGLRDNPSKADSKLRNRALMDRADAAPARFAERSFFSPIRQTDILKASAELISGAERAVFISAPFGVDRTMIDALGGNSSDIIEYGLVNATAKRKIDGLRHHNTRFFPPNKLKTHMGERWDAKAFGAHKIHAKVIVTDPWSDNPKVLIGSANFSNASCRDNDENAMLVTGDKRLAAVLATEFLRMYDHYKSRYYIDLTEDRNKPIRKENRARSKRGEPPLPLERIPVHLKSDDSWSDTAFDPAANSRKFRDRLVFSGR